MVGRELRSFERKLIWADKHYKAVLDVLAGCAYGECQMIPEKDVELNVGILRVRLPSPPSCLPMLLGDFFFNARASLDYLVWQLVEITPPHKHTVKNMFPICSSPKAFADQVRRHRLDGLPEKAPAIIEGLQPYPGRNNPLRRMADLHELDKHQMLTLTTAVSKDTFIDWSRGGATFFSMVLGNEELRDGAIFGDVGVPLDDPQIAARFADVEVKGKAAIFIAFEDSTAEELEPLRVDAVLQEILEFIRETVFPSFQPFFD
jgi:hypothetical protein